MKLASLSICYNTKKKQGRIIVRPSANRRRSACADDRNLFGRATRNSAKRDRGAYRAHSRQHDDQGGIGGKRAALVRVGFASRPLCGSQITAVQWSGR